MSGYLTIGVDIGTTGVKASLLDTRSGQVIGDGFQQHPLFIPKPGYAEQEGDNYWNAVVSAIKQCLQGGDYSDNVAAIALSGLVGVTLPIDKNGRPVRRGMIWMDARADIECDEIRNKVGEEKINWNNGNRIANWFIEPKALWMKKNEPDNFEKTYKFLSPSGYCTYRLCEQFTINKSDAGLFYPYDYQNGCWNEDIAKQIGIPIEKYPQIYDCDEVVGEITENAAVETGLKKGTLVIAGGTDISSAALGSGVTEAGQAFYSMGTGSNLGIIIPTKQRINEFRILKWPHVIDGLTMFDAPMAYTGASLKWFSDMFGANEKLLAEATGMSEFTLLTLQAERIKPGSDGLLYAPYMGNSLSPNWNSTAKGIFFGASLSTTRAHMIRAIIEGVAFDVYSNIKIALSSGAKIDKLILNGGPTKSAFWNQITANVTNIPLETTNINEAAPLGDAVLAAKGAGLYDNLIDPVKSFVKTTSIVEPDQNIHKIYEELFGIWQRVSKNLTKEMEDLHKLMFKVDELQK